MTPPKTVLQHTSHGEVFSGAAAPSLPVLDAALGLDALKAPALEAARSYMQHTQEKVKLQFLAGKLSAVNAVVALSNVMDHTLKWLVSTGLKACQAKGTLPPDITPATSPLVLLAVGGYGRKEMFPYSDVDILILHGKEYTEAAEALTEFLLYVLWDLGLKLGQAIHPVSDIAEQKKDIATLSSWLDARVIVGNRKFYNQLRRELFGKRSQAEEAAFVKDKMAERDKRHATWGDSRYILEPNIKEGKGGLRDLHTLYWLARYIYNIRRMRKLVERGQLTADEYRHYKKAREFLWKVRLHMHYHAGRAEERLTFDMQRHISKILGYRGKTPNAAVERFMKHYFQVAREVGFLTNLFCTNLEAQQIHQPRLSISRFLAGSRRLEEFVILGNHRLAVESDTLFKEQPALMIKLFYLAGRFRLDIHPHTLRLVSRSLRYIDANTRKDERACRLFLSMLLDPVNGDRALREMKEAGVLARFIPEFSRIIGQMQFDMYHVYTVDEHTLVALGVLHSIEAGKLSDELPLASDVIAKLSSRRVLHMAVLCHDVAKGMGGNHAIKGSEIAAHLAGRFGYTQEEQEMIAWLVRYHILFTDYAFKRDLSDPETIRGFAQKIQSLEKLRLLLVLTVADVRAVGPNVWNGWKGALMRELYYRTENFMQTGNTDMPHAQSGDILTALKKELKGWRQEDIQGYIDICPSSYLLSREAPEHAEVARMLREVTKKDGPPFALRCESQSFLHISTLTLCAPDRQGLLSDIAAALALAGANIVGARIYTLKNGWAVQSWQVQSQENKELEEEAVCGPIAGILRQTIEGTRNVAKELAARKPTYPTRAQNFSVTPQVFFENGQSDTFTIVEVIARDRPGLLHMICHAFLAQGLNIGSAHITTYGEQAVDVFYVKDAYGFKLVHPARLEHMREVLLETLGKLQA